MSQIELLKILKVQLVNFLDELIATFPSETDFVIYRIFVKDQLPIVDIMRYIINNLCPHYNMIKQRDEKFFLNYNVLFEKFEEKQSNKANYFKKMWTSGNLDKEEKENIWKWFECFVDIALKYDKSNGGKPEIFFQKEQKD
jgi:hypothetical protein